MRKTKSIAWKLSGLVIGLFLLLFVVYSIVTNTILYNKSVEDSENYANEHAKLYAAGLSQRFEHTSKTLMTAKHMFEALNDEKKMTAQSALKMVEKNLTENPNIFGMGLILESNSVPIESTMNKTLIDQQHRFIPYLYKEGDTIHTEAINGYETEGDGDWYQIPKKEGRPILTEPYDYEAGSETIPMATISVPLFSKENKFIGVMTADFSIEFLNDVVRSMKPDGGYASIVTDQGFVVANSINEKLIGTNIEEALDWKKIRSDLGERKTSTLYVDSKQLKEKAFNTFAPVSVQGIDEIWSVQTVVPKSSILQTFKAILLLTIVAAVLMIILMAVASSLFIHRQLKPLVYLRKSIETAASGDLTRKVDPSHIRQDEIGMVASAFNDMLDKTNQAINVVKGSSVQLNDSASQVHQAFEEVSAASEEVSAAIDEIAQGASQQSMDTEDVNQRIADLSEQIDSLAALSNSMNQLSVKAGQSTKQGMDQVQLLREHNKDTDRMNEKVQQQIQTLSNKIANIDMIIASIHGITAQTNLLALNASIEAARAGEHGKGFAVVAEEVRKLAEQSRQETDVIQKTVQEILEESKQTVAIITKNIELVEVKNQSVVSTESAFKENAQLAKQLGESIAELSTKLDEMMEYKEQAMESIQSVSAISEETAASAEQVSASAAEQKREMGRVAVSTEKMNNIAGELKEVVSRFKV
ncbi:methyl-accepting chemotaxis protein [Pseudobacillus wudalianchiensis]|uniref:Chemotaxis protein n=2 Tax=Pseudobacillus wudalianchiensis TaxID=1743143 RepID=A0A1B9AAI7_9BACI|nr:methyl-accepting chemotaxis protein [Bacillus wudalianchiensis]OCA80858.1 chemotaxis protein [Bacillus wudalianchiensis]